MSRYCPRVAWVLLVWIAVAPVGVARADVFGDVLVGLDHAGFQFAGQHNPLSDGATVGTARNFNNTVLDFGPTDLTLTGPVSASFTTGGRGIRTLDFALNVGAPGNPLFYSYVDDLGASQLRVDGSTVFDVNGSINQFGWYDLQFQFSSRQTASNTGRFANTDGTMLDFDVGPIDVSGNIFADLLATVTDPFFESSGYENVFASFSGRTARENSLESTVSNLRAKAAAGMNLSEREVSDLVTMAMISQVHGDEVPDLSFLELSRATGADYTLQGVGRAVPEPSMLAFLLPAAWWISRRRRSTSS
ncbi:MAG: hypothetical protein ACYSUQ_05405 [Planctomycetota bacterium]